MDRIKLAVLAAAVVAVAVVVPIVVGSLPAGDQQARERAVTVADSNVSGPTVVTVGDISCKPGEPVTESTCRSAATAKLASSMQPDRVLTLGDQQYDVGALSAFRSAYADTWGALKSMTRPVPGNHEYRTTGASGYYTYFDRRQPGPPGYYAFAVGNWRIYALNSNCGFVNCDRQARWLDRAMSRNSRRCSILTMHHPRYSSGPHRGTRVVKRFWRVALEHRADIALAGHDHDYERFRRMNASGSPSRTGMVSFVAGAGGRSLYDFGAIAPGSLVRDNAAPGVLALTLGDGRYAWRYQTIDGVTVDAGTAGCV